MTSLNFFLKKEEDAIKELLGLLFESIQSLLSFFFMRVAMIKRFLIAALLITKCFANCLLCLNHSFWTTVTIVTQDISQNYNQNLNGVVELVGRETWML